MTKREELLARAREKAERAAEAYRLSKEEFNRVHKESGWLPTREDGVCTILQAVRRQAQATKEFYLVARELNDLILGRHREAAISRSAVNRRVVGSNPT